MIRTDYRSCDYNFCSAVCINILEERGYID